MKKLKKLFPQRIEALQERARKNENKEDFRWEALDQMLCNMYRTLGYMCFAWEVEDHPTVGKNTNEICDTCNDGSCAPCVDGTPGTGKGF